MWIILNNPATLTPKKNNIFFLLLKNMGFDRTSLFDV